MTAAIPICDEWESMHFSSTCHLNWFSLINSEEVAGSDSLWLRDAHHTQHIITRQHSAGKTKNMIF